MIRIALVVAVLFQAGMNNVGAGASSCTGGECTRDEADEDAALLQVKEHGGGHKASSPTELQRPASMKHHAKLARGQAAGMYANRTAARKVSMPASARARQTKGCPNRCQGDACQTTVTETLNGMIAEGGAGTYSGGKGILIRAPDFFSGHPPTVVPATFWVNDIIAPSQVYPGPTSPWCPNNGWDGYYKVDSCQEGPWEYAQLAAVVGTSMNKMMYEYDKLQTPDWGWGVFYPTDANAADQRCRNLESEGGWDCPDYFVQYDGTKTYDQNRRGAGWYEPGNPRAGMGGGGAGCHWGVNINGQGKADIDQQDAIDGNGVNLVGDRDCQCNYDLKGNYWYDWVGHFLNNAGSPAQGGTGKDFDGLWFAEGKMPSWGMDSAICWVNNIYDLIGLQNAIYRTRASWNNGLVPEIDYSSTNPQEQRKYWGWNEIPVRGRSEAGVGYGIDDPQVWDAVMIKLPAAVCNTDSGDPEDGGADSICCLHPEAQAQLEADIDTWVKQGKLVPGEAHAGSRPGSTVVLAREHVTDNGNGPEWRRWFFCEDWTSPNGKYHVVYDPANNACYVE